MERNLEVWRIYIKHWPPPLKIGFSIRGEIGMQLLTKEYPGPHVHIVCCVGVFVDVVVLFYISLIGRWHSELYNSAFHFDFPFRIRINSWTPDKGLIASEIPKKCIPARDSSKRNDGFEDKKTISRQRGLQDVLYKIHPRIY